MVEDKLFPFTDRFMQMLFVGLKQKTGIDKELTPKTLRHTHVVRAYKRGEDLALQRHFSKMSPKTLPIGLFLSLTIVQISRIKAP